MKEDLNKRVIAAMTPKEENTSKKLRDENSAKVSLREDMGYTGHYYWKYA